MIGKMSKRSTESDAGDTEKQWSLADFEIGGPLGKGKFGRVYLAREAKVLISLRLSRNEMLDKGRDFTQFELLLLWKPNFVNQLFWLRFWDIE